MPYFKPQRSDDWHPTFAEAHGLPADHDPGMAMIERQTPYQRDQYLRNHGIDPVLLAADTVILIAQLKKGLNE